MAGRADDMRQRYERFSQGDLEGALSNWAEDIVWQGPNAQGLPGSGTHEGREAAMRALQAAVGAYDSFELTADEFYEDGDTVVVLAHTVNSKGGRSVQLPTVHIWRFRDDEIVRFEYLTDTLETARLLGVA
jgi:ketosteroid isomerase-like protein